MRVLAIDPGFDRLGVAILEYQNGKEILIFSTCIETNRTDTLPDRLFSLGEKLNSIINEYKPDVLAIETLFFNKNITTGIGVAQARGIVIYEAKKAGCVIYEFGPQEVKVAVTGYGNSDKKAVYAMLTRLVPTIPKKSKDDEYDAIAVGITCLAHHGRS